MKRLFKDIRQGNIDTVRSALQKHPEAVNEIFDGKAPKKDIGQSPLQVAIKCGQFEIIELLLENGADADFMENPADVPPHSVCMPVLHDAIIGAMVALLYHHYESSRKYAALVGTLLEKGADPNKETFCGDNPANNALPVCTLVMHAKENLQRFTSSTVDKDDAALAASKKALFDILDMLKRYGADFDRWLDSEWGDETFREAFLEDFVPKADMPFEVKYHGRVIKGVSDNSIDRNKEIRAALREYFQK